MSNKSKCAKEPQDRTDKRGCCFKYYKTVYWPKERKK